MLSLGLLFHLSSTFLCWLSAGHSRNIYGPLLSPHPSYQSTTWTLIPLLWPHMRLWINRHLGGWYTLATLSNRMILKCRMEDHMICSPTRITQSREERSAEQWLLTTYKDCTHHDCKMLIVPLALCWHHGM